MNHVGAFVEFLSFTSLKNKPISRLPRRGLCQLRFVLFTLLFHTRLVCMQSCGVRSVHLTKPIQCVTTATDSEQRHHPPNAAFPVTPPHAPSPWKPRTRFGSHGFTFPGTFQKYNHAPCSRRVASILLRVVVSLESVLRLCFFVQINTWHTLGVQTLILITFIIIHQTSFEKPDVFINKSQMGWGLSGLGGSTDWLCADSSTQCFPDLPGRKHLLGCGIKIQISRTFSHRF